jgi:uncharacterized protein (TIGR03437 family)
MRRSVILSLRAGQTTRLSLIALITGLVSIVPSWGSSASAEKVALSVVTVSAASFLPNVPLAPDSIGAAFGSALATRSEAAATNPLPFNLAGTTVRINGELAPLLYVSPGQINYVIPSDTSRGLATVEVTSGDGTVSMGTLEIESVSPGLFTADRSGSGPLAAQLLRIKANGEQVYENLVRFDGLNFSLQPIEFGDEGDHLYLVLYLTGLRHAAISDVRVVIGGVSYGAPQLLYAGPSNNYVGLDQINFELMRSFQGRGRITLLVEVAGSAASNAGEIAVGAQPTVSSSQLQIEAPNTAVLAGNEVAVNGTGFAPNPPDNMVKFVPPGDVPSMASVLSLGSNSLHFRVPFGAGTGLLSVSRGSLETSAPVRVRTSISGFVDAAQTMPDGSIIRIAAANLVVRLRSNPAITQQTGPNGSYVLPDVPAGNQEVEILAQQVALPYPDRRFKVSVREGYDNQAGRAELKAIGTASGPGILALAFIDSGRSPADLPIGAFSTRIVQLTPFGVRIPGAKLTFANTDAIPAGNLATLYKMDQTPDSPTVGQFVQIGTARVSADGQSVETADNAITEGSYYFVSVNRPLCRIRGRVVESDGQPVPQALVQARGQSVRTDGFGGFVLPNVPLLKDTGDRIRVEVSYLRPDGSVSRKDSPEVELHANTLIAISPEIMIPPQVTKAATATAVTSITNPSAYGQTVTFTAMVKLSPPGPGSVQGDVSFYDGATLLGTVASANGNASLTTKTLNVGSHVITAVYAGNSQYSGSTSPTINQMVNKGATTVALSSLNNPSFIGQQLTLTAGVNVITPASGNPTGSVQFFAGGNPLGSASLNSGMASVTTSVLAVGTYPITAVYGGDSNFDGDTSAVINQVVRKGSTSVSLTSLNNPSTFGQVVTLKATLNVVAPASGNPTGSILFVSNGISIGSVSLSGGMASLATSALTVGTNSITAFFGGDNKFNESTSPVFNQSVNKIGTTTTLTSSPNPSNFFTAVTFTAHVFPSSTAGGGPTGAVSFNINGLMIASSVNPATGIASITVAESTIPFNASAQAPCTASYAGNAVLNSSISPIYIQKHEFVIVRLDVERPQIFAFDPAIANANNSPAGDRGNRSAPIFSEYPAAEYKTAREVQFAPGSG